MNTYTLNTSIDQVEATISQLTAKGRETMEAVGKGELTYFDEGIVEHSGIWGECLVSEMGHKSSGVVNRLRDLGLWITGPEDDQDSGMWWALTALGADVANFLAGKLDFQVASERIGLKDEDVTLEDVAAAVERSQEVTVKVGRIWTYVYRGETLLAEIRTDAADAVVAALTK